MALLSPAQIKDAIAQRAAIASLQQSYDASKVITSIVKPESDSYYSANEILQTLNETVTNLSNDNINETFTDAEIASIFND
jgi:hypothetical protein